MDPRFTQPERYGLSKGKKEEPPPPPPQPPESGRLVRVGPKVFLVARFRFWLKRRGGWRNGIEGWCAREATDLRKGEGTGGGICFVSFSKIIMANFGLGSLEKGEGEK
jgi:hypothetical protein